MSILKNFFNSEKQENPEEDNFNKLLRKMDKHRYNNEVNQKTLVEPETAFDIIAIINKFEHEKLNIYKDENGERWIRTKYGFEPVIIYNKTFENNQLKDEIKARENEIFNLKLSHERMLNVVEHEQSININYREKIKRQNSEAFFRLIRSKEAKKIRKMLASINKILLNNATDKIDENELIKNPDITRTLIKTVKLNNQLKQDIIDAYTEIEKLIAFISASSTNGEKTDKN